MEEKDAPREVLGIAIVMETESVRFYEDMAAQSPSANVKELCRRMAEEEARHLALYEEMQMAWAATFRSSPVGEPEFQTTLAQARKSFQPEGQGVQCERVADEGHVPIVAMEREKQAVLFYERLLKLFPRYAEVINQIIREEDAHVDELEDLAIEIAGIPQ